MNTFTPSLLQAARAATLALAVSGSGLAMAQTAAFDADCAPQLSGMQQRLFDKADEGPGVLRDFMFARRGILCSSTSTTRASGPIRSGRAVLPA